MPDGLIIFLCVAGVILALLLLKHAGGGNAFSPYRRKRLMTRHEMVMYHKLVRALSDTPYIVCPQVSMGAVMDIKSGVDGKQRLGLRNRFDRKIIDFVIADEEGHARLLVELDDSSHVSSRDRERDSLTTSAGYRTLRYRKAGTLDVRSLRRDMAEIIRAQN
ncbi:DUF2726 domain-containing protein [uncultured Salinicola sp.]|uniref:DUF2726 domain-containing protein n=1 Tax=uncultured Salinicola sp. TaxID=1193542 RepID=UPI00345D6288|tara:strand:- start:2759 stop:3244 length:486 start_codon:yes stop_codon:yes gene_type:complete